jgi:hypothetical protein
MRDGHPPARALFTDEANFLDRAPNVAEVVQDHLALEVAPGIEGIAKWQYPVRLRRAARNAMDAITHDGIPEDIYISNGLRPESQRLIHSLRDISTFHCVEDGLDSYFESNQMLGKQWYRSAYRLFNGAVHPPGLDMLRAADYVSVECIVPELCRAPPSLVREIPVASLKGATAALGSALGLEVPTSQIVDLVLLSHSESISDIDRYLSALLDMVRSRALDTPSTGIAMKAHPRERNARFLDQLAEQADYVVPNWVPVELLVDWMEPTVRVHCGMTTFILTSKRLLPKRTVTLDDGVPAAHAAALHEWDSAIGLASRSSSLPATDRSAYS